VFPFIIEAKINTERASCAALRERFLCVSGKVPTCRVAAPCTVRSKPTFVAARDGASPA
jgi:hypothetical protein